MYTKTEYGDYKRIQLWEILKQPSNVIANPSLRSRVNFAKQPEPVREIPIFLGAKAFLPCRLIIQRLPDEKNEILEQERRKKACLPSSQAGKTLSKEKLALCGWNLYVSSPTPKAYGLFVEWTKGDLTAETLRAIVI